MWSAAPGADWPTLVAHAAAATLRAAAGACWSACPTARTSSGSIGRADDGPGRGPPRRCWPPTPARRRATATSWPSPAGPSGSSSAPAPRRSRRSTTSGWWSSGTTATTCTPSRARPTRTPARCCCCAPSSRARRPCSGASPAASRRPTCSAPAGPTRSPPPARRPARPRHRRRSPGPTERGAGPRPLRPRGADPQRGATRSCARRWPTGPVLVQTPRSGLRPQPGLRALPRRPARCPRCSGPLALTGPTTPPACRWCGTAEEAWACAGLRPPGLRAPVLGDARTAEELGRTFPQAPIRQLQRRPGPGPRRRRTARSWWRPPAPSRSPTAATPRSLLLDTWLLPGPRRPAHRRGGAAPLAQRRRRWSGPAAASWRSATRPSPRSRRWCAGTRPASPSARPPSAARPACRPRPRIATLTGEPGAVDDALTLRRAAAGRRGARPGAARRGRASGARCSGCPRSQGVALSRALGELQRLRSARKLDAVRIQVDPHRLSRLAARPHRRGDPLPIQPIRLFGDPVLRTRAVEVVDFDKELRKLVEDLTDTMLDAPGAGLAAPQIGVGLRVFTWYVDGEVGHLVNPDLDLSEETQDGPEGCLSMPGPRLRLPARAVGGRPGLRPCTASRSPSRAPSCWPARSSTRPTTSTACCSSTGSTPSTRKVAMRQIREAEWFGAEQPDREGVARTPPAGWGSDGLMRLVFAGTPEVALPALDAIAASGHELVGVVTRPDAPAGRGRRLHAVAGRPAGRGARRARPQARPPARPRLPGRAARAAPRTAARSSPTARCVPQSALDIPVHGWVNLHFSCLPAWRGAAPVQHALWAGDEVTGATTFRIVRELDAGPTYGVMTERIRPDRHRRRPARPARRGRRRAARGHPRRHRGRLARGAAAAGGRRLLRPQDHRRRRPRRLDRARRRRRPPDPGLHARRPAPGRLRRRRADQARPGHASPTATSRWRPGELAVGKSEVLVGTGTAPVRLGDVKAVRQAADAGRRLGPRGPGRRRTPRLSG